MNIEVVMKRKMMLIFLISGLLLSMSDHPKERKYGKGITLSQETKIGDVFQDPSNFLDEEIMITGIITNVCDERGIWLNVVGEGSYDYLMCVIDNENYSFPQNVIGKTCSIQGTFGRFSSKDELLINILLPRECHHCHEECVVNSSEKGGHRGRGGRRRSRSYSTASTIPDSLNVIFIEGAVIK